MRLVPLWMLSDDMGITQLFANLADAIELQGDLFFCGGLKASLRLLLVQISDTAPTIH